LECLADRPDGLGLADLCNDLNMPKSVAHRLLALLIDQGFVRQDGDSARYCLTLKLTLLGLRYYAGTGLKDVSQPILDGLADRTGELVRLALVENDRMVWVGKAQGARYGLRYDPDTGYEVVLHATATGKAWLATLDESDAVRIIAATGFRTPPRFGPNAIRTVEAFLKALAETRERGYGIAVEEGEPGTAAVAVAVRASASPDAPTAATLSAAGPVVRFTPERQQKIARQLQFAAEELSALWPIRRVATDDGHRSRSTFQSQEAFHNVG
jgi:DNA-binding IclR family transcriptional regulator